MTDAQIEEARQLVRRLIALIGDDPDRPGLKETPDRVVRSWSELYAGYDQDPQEFSKDFDSDGYDQVVALRNIEFWSMCEHHMLPFFGKAHVAYLPGNGRVLGVSKIARIVNCYARRLQIQEQMTQQIASTIESILGARGVAVVVEGHHLCMVARGARQHQGAEMVTSCMRGTFREDVRSRSEVTKLLLG